MVLMLMDNTSLDLVIQMEKLELAYLLTLDLMKMILLVIQMDLVFGTRPNTLSDNVGRERMRITDKGVRQYPCANDASHAYQGIYQELSGKKQLTGSGNFTDIVEHGHSCNDRLQYYVLEDDNNSLGGGPGSADLFVRYGSGAYTNHVHSLSGMNGGSVSTPEIQYVNAGAKLQFRVTWSFLILCTFTGISVDVAIGRLLHYNK